MIWDSYLYGLCFILRNYTVRLRGYRERDENGELGVKEENTVENTK